MYLKWEKCGKVNHVVPFQNIFMNRNLQREFQQRKNLEVSLVITSDTFAITFQVQFTLIEAYTQPMKEKELCYYPF